VSVGFYPFDCVVLIVDSHNSGNSGSSGSSGSVTAVAIVAAVASVVVVLRVFVTGRDSFFLQRKSGNLFIVRTFNDI
jgi:hypothetical protein